MSRSARHQAAENKPFTFKKQKILAALGVDDNVYTDASPKGNLDAPIRGLISQINAIEGLVTTSSCSGRVSVFVDGVGTTKDTRGNGDEGLKSARQAVPDGHEGEDSIAVSGGERGDVRSGGGGGKGGGRWLFVSHEGDKESLDRGREEIALVLGLTGTVRDFALNEKRLDLDQSWSRGGQRLVHFKFEPMILHILTASLHIAQLVLGAAQQAGFRESGASSLISETPMVAIRTNGIALESIVGVEADGQLFALVDNAYMARLWGVAEARFVANADRIKRFEELMRKAFAEETAPLRHEWEDAETRKTRKRAEGLQKQAQMLGRKEQGRTAPHLQDAHVIFEDND